MNNNWLLLENVNRGLRSPTLTLVLSREPRTRWSSSIYYELDYRGLKEFLPLVLEH